MENTPLNPDNILDASQFSFNGDFDEQVLEILTRVRLTRAEVENLQCLLDDLQKALTYTWPGCQVYPFGSIVTGLGIKTSDIDCYVNVPHVYINRRAKPVLIAKRLLGQHPRKFTRLFAIACAKVPILKFVHIPTSFNCDINFSSFSGVVNSKLIAFLLNLDERVLPLTILIKYWSKVYNFTGTNLMPNYGLTMMVIFYLQEQSILPSIAKLQQDIQVEMVDNWNVAFDDDIIHETDNDQSLYQLLGGFFHYYKNFDFKEYIISPFLGYPIKKQLLTNISSVPTEYQMYIENVVNKKCKEIRLDGVMCIQDPFDHSRNCTGALFSKLFIKINAQIELAASMFDERETHSFLKEILTTDCVIRTQQAIPKTAHKNTGKVVKRPKQKRSLQRAIDLHRLYIESKKLNKGALHQACG